jgi:rhodanese-related sulfurtransferase
MEIYSEFITNHSTLFIALVIILFFLVQTIYTDATRKYKVVSAPETTNLINRQEAVVIDVRNQNEFKAGHIAGAVHVPLTDIKQSNDKLNKYEGKPMLFYCKSSVEAGEACKILSKQGKKDIYCLRGGVQSWQDAGMPLVKD